MPAEQALVRKMDDSSSVAEVISVILDKGIVIDRWASASVLGLELLTIEARMVVTSVETYLRYADAIACLTPAAPPSWQRAVFDGDSKHDQVLEGEVLRALSAHPEALAPASPQAFLDAPRTWP